MCPIASDFVVISGHQRFGTHLGDSTRYTGGTSGGTSSSTGAAGCFTSTIFPSLHRLRMDLGGALFQGRGGDWEPVPSWRVSGFVQTPMCLHFLLPHSSPPNISSKKIERGREREGGVCVYVCSQFTGNRKYRISDQIMSHPQNKLDKQSLIYLLQPNWPGFGPSCCRTRSKENSWRRVIFGSPSIIETSSPFCYCRRSWPLKLTAMRWRERWLVEISKPLFEAAVEHQKTWVWFQENVDLCVNSGDFTKTNGGPQHARPAKNRLSLVWQYLALEW